jgi:LDH2 family malate/lactate/ureidoglycolate dehydrogenase
MHRCTKESLIEFGTRFLQAKGSPEANARVVAETAVQTQAMGIHTHGLAVFSYFDKAIPDLVDPGAEPELIKQTGATAVIDGHKGFAQLALKLAKDIALPKALEQGLALVTVRDVCWLGALGVYLVSLGERGLMAQLWAQTTTCKDAAPLGGVEAKFSTNPMALIFPTGGDPVLSDFSTTTISMGKTTKMVNSRVRAAEQIFMDSTGRLSNDPKVVKQGGSILFLGGAHYGHKGYGLSLWCEAVAALAGGACNNPEAKQSQSVGLIIIDPAAFAGREYQQSELERFKAHLVNNRLRPGFEEIRLPGQRVYQSLRDSEAQGIPVEEVMLDSLNTLAGENNIPAITTL